MTIPVVTALYVPGDRPEWFDNAVDTGTQLVILDLEDAVAPDRKGMAREAVANWLAKRAWADEQDVEVRINPGDHTDLDAIAGVVEGDVGLRVPKVESAGGIEAIVTALGYPPRIAAVVETAAGLEALPRIAVQPAVQTLSLGEADLASDLGSADVAVLDWARIQLLVAARAARKPAPMMSVYTDIRDVAGLRDDTLRGKSMGFVGRTAVHPSQLPVIIEAFRPSDDELRWAESVLAATEDGGVATLASGEMVDPAMRGRAESILGLAATTRESGIR